MARKISTTALAFEIKNKFIAHREGRLDTQSLNFEICRYMYTYNKIIIIGGDFHSQMYNILGNDLPT